MALAGLGRTQQAIDEARQALELQPISLDALWGRAFHDNLAWIYMRLGNRDQAIEQLEYLLSVPGPMTANLLQLDPHYQELEDQRRFRNLIDRS